MPYIEMEIDSLRHAMHKDEWVILLKDRAGQRYLPVYVDKAWADAIAKIMMNEMSEEVIDAEIEGRVKQMRDMGSEVVLVIDDAGDGIYKAKFIGQSCEIECGVGKGLAMAMRSGVGMFAEEEMVDKAGVINKA